MSLGGCSQKKKNCLGAVLLRVKQMQILLAQFIKTQLTYLIIEPRIITGKEKGFDHHHRHNRDEPGC